MRRRRRRHLPAGPFDRFHPSKSLSLPQLPQRLALLKVLMLALALGASEKRLLAMSPLRHLPTPWLI